ncbi:non-ribosomal peptide synthetase [Methylovulum psychrotolerans]|uniref:Non-ribosomal peptide synthetase n=2 Tax=Methylovulum psychrotolerans TaxID=1704499 RepID=A0A2S5CKB1_9GAMM|nr:non-ribosomal peptide synthetase [Methylovulum psychrotolerans]
MGNSREQRGCISGDLMNARPETVRVDVSAARTLAEILQIRAERQSPQAAYTFLADADQTAVTLSYGELDSQARRIAAKLLALGVPGDRAVLLYPQGLDYIAAFFGCLYAGVIAVPAYPPKNQRHLPRLHGIIADCQAALILTQQALIPSLQALFGDAVTVPIVATEALGEAGLTGGLPATDPQGVAFLQYTSGSTGNPKGVVVTHANLMANQALIQQGFGHDAASTVVGWLPLYHDMGLIGNVMQPLFIGAPAVLMSPMAFLEKPARWLQAVSDYRAHTSGGPNFAYALCTEKITAEEKSRLDLSAWQVAFNGAEPVQAATLERFAAAFAECGFRRQAFYPCYGLAEATLLVTGGSKTALPTLKAFDKAKLAAHIASPVPAGDANSRLLVGCGFVGTGHQLRIADRDTQAVCGEGCIGEIQVSGASVTQGYWHNAEASAESVSVDAAQRVWLRTGDLGFLDHGELFVSGRSKELIIIRGRNYYPQDIEMAVAAAVPCVNPNALAAFAVAAGDGEKLVVLAELKRAYLKQSDFSAEFAAIRSHLVTECAIQADTLMFVKPGGVLKTTSGKTRRNDCKQAFISQQLTVVATDGLSGQTTAPSAAELAGLRQAIHTEPLTVARKLLGQYLRGQLQTLAGLAAAQVNLSIPVLSLGIDSLKALALKQVLDELLDIDFPITFILADKSAWELAEHALELSRQPPLATVSPTATANRVSAGQLAIWTACQLAASSAVYNLPIAIQISGGIAIDSLRHALQRLVARHPQLHTGYQTENGLPVPIVLDPPYQVLSQHLCRNAQHRNQQLSAEIYRPFNLHQDVKLRAVLFSTANANDGHILLFCAHHIAVDFRSLQILLGELPALYAAHSMGQTLSLPILTATYRDFSDWQHAYLPSAAAQQALSYWQQQLAGELPTLRLPGAANRQNPAAYNGGIETLAIGFDTTWRLQQLAAQQGVTLYMVLLAVFKALLYRYSGQNDIIVGSPLFGRPKREFAQVVGYFANPVALRSYPNGAKTFAEFLHEVKATVLGALQHQDYPHSLLAETLQRRREPGAAPLYQVCFVLQADAADSSDAAALALGMPDCSLAWPGLTAKTVGLPDTAAQFDLNLMMAMTDKGLAASFQYPKDVFSPAAIVGMAGHFQHLLQGVLANPLQPLRALPLLSVAESLQILAWNRINFACPADACLPALFEQQVMVHPDAPAVAFEDQALSYAELNAKANQLAHYLRGQGVVAETVVGICLPRSLELLVGLLGVLKAGGAYLPLDPDYPAERLAYMVADARPLLVLAEQAVTAVLPPDCRVFCLDSQAAEVVSHSTANPAKVGNADNLAYIIYTSGSTGTPKGVAVTHHNVRRLFAATEAVFDFSAADVWCLFHSFAFDFSVWELWGALLYGGKLVIVPYWLSRSPAALHQLLSAQGVTVLNQTPSSFYQLAAYHAEHGGANALALRWVIFGGEALEPWRLQPWLASQAGHGPQLVNMYGITETTVHVSQYLLPPTAATETASRIGWPLADLQTFIFDAQLNPVPVGVTGELYIGGAGLARGYLNRPELTAERFIPHPYSSQPGQRLYRTGDLARYCPDGNLEYQGRSDNQVKIRGFRIELGEIEARLLQHPDIKAAVVLARTDAEHSYLQAYLVAPAAQPEHQTLKAFLKQTLPDYMVPSAFVSLEALPLTANGKLDRKALLALDSPGWQRRAYTAPRDEAEQAVAEIWQQILGIEQLGIYDDFFELGGHSLSAVQIVSKIRDTFAVDVPVQTLFEAPTIAEFVDKVAEYQID